MSKRGVSRMILKCLGLPALAALACALAACEGEKPAEAAVPDIAASAAALPAASTGAPTRTREQAMAALMALPELKAWSSRIEKASSGAVHPALIEDDPAPRMINGKNYWQFSFVENHKDAVRRWESFLVAQAGDDILVEDFATDAALTLEQWRRDKHPMERTAAE